jgi:hypothetical protein
MAKVGNMRADPQIAGTLPPELQIVIDDVHGA